MAYRVHRLRHPEDMKLRAWVELDGSQYRSVFLPQHAEHAQTHATKADAIRYAAKTLKEIFRLENRPAQVKAIYDEPEMVERYTVVLRERAAPDAKHDTFLGLSEGGIAFSQWGEGVCNARTCGKRIAWADLSEATRKHIIARLGEWKETTQ